jgi:hypothetical protein
MVDTKKSDALDDITQGTPKDRKRRQTPVLPNRVLKLIVAVVAVVVVIVVIVVAVTSARGGSSAADYLSYMSSVSDILKQSDAIGGKLTDLLSNPGDTSRKEIQTKLEQYATESEKLETKATELPAPKDLVEAGVHQFFLMVMSFRHEGLATLSPSLMNALDTQDSSVSAEAIAESLYYLTNSDFIYKHLYVKQATDIIKQKNLEGVTVPDSVFFTDPDLASVAQAQQIVTQLKSVGQLQAVHGVAVASVVEQPDDQEIKKGQTYNLTASDQLQIVVTVENQGNMSEKDVPVVVTLTPQSGGEPQTVTVTIAELKPNSTADAVITGLNPTAYGEVSTLTIEVGPVDGEKVMTNNKLEATVIFKL